VVSLTATRMEASLQVMQPVSLVKSHYNNKLLVP
jgi:hypothetical protein